MDFKILKKIVFGLLITMGMLNAQNNLVFNQVLLLELSTTNPAIVPEGKVWKIEGFNTGGNGAGTCIILNNSIYFLGSASAFPSPTWLPENSEIKRGGCNQTSSNSVSKISVLEFNVVPTSTGTGSGTGGGGVSSDGLVFSQMINEAITTQPTTTSGTVIYSFQVPNGHVWKIRYMSIDYWNSTSNAFQGSVLGGSIFITTNDEGPFIKQGPSVNSTNDYALLLKEGNYQVKYFHYGNGSSGNRLYFEAIEYRIP